MFGEWVKRFNLDYDVQPYNLTAILGAEYIDDVEKRVRSIEFIVIYCRNKDTYYVDVLISNLMAHPEITLYQKLRLSLARMKLCSGN